MSEDRARASTSASTDSAVMSHRPSTTEADRLQDTDDIVIGKTKCQSILCWSLLVAVTCATVARLDLFHPVCHPTAADRCTKSYAAQILQPKSAPASSAAARPKFSREQCSQTCRIEIIETIPENLTFAAGSFIPRSTFDCWRELIVNAEERLFIAAYKSSLRGKHVLPIEHYSRARHGDQIYDELLAAGNERNVTVRMVEHFPPKDRGDNADGESLKRKGAAEQHVLHYGRLLGTGAMHSKFLIADSRSFYLGSANLDWRSLSQKMELGVSVVQCECLARDLRNVFHSYWKLGHPDSEAPQFYQPSTDINITHPLPIQYNGETVHTYLATSPQQLNGDGRTWDLHAILQIIENAQHFLDVHVMDYIPMIVYKKPVRYWPVIDAALRKAVVERHVRLRLLTAALHFVPQSMNALQSLSAVNQSLVQVKIFKVPRLEFAADSDVLSRERRTHNKFMLSETTAIIGTSNWSGDYFTGTSGVAIVLNQTVPDSSGRRSFVDDMARIFERDWQSDYAHPLDFYVDECFVDSDLRHLVNPDICEMDKPKSLLNNDHK